MSYHLIEAMSALLKKQPMFGYKFTGKGFDYGDKVGFQMANTAFSAERQEIREQATTADVQIHRLPSLADSVTR